MRKNWTETTYRHGNYILEQNYVVVFKEGYTCRIVNGINDVLQQFDELIVSRSFAASWPLRNYDLFTLSIEVHFKIYALYDEHYIYVIRPALFTYISDWKPNLSNLHTKMLKFKKSDRSYCFDVWKELKRGTILATVKNIKAVLFWWQHLKDVFFMT